MEINEKLEKKGGNMEKELLEIRKEVRDTIVKLELLDYRLLMLLYKLENKKEC